MFEFLTASGWDAGCGDRCYRVHLRRDGKFLYWTHSSEVISAPRESRWNFASQDDSSGLVLTADSSVIRFVRRGPKLEFEGRLYERAQVRGDPPDDPRGTCERLPAILLPSKLQRLTCTRWVREDDFVHPPAPEVRQLRFGPYGEIEETLDDGQRVLGSFSLDRGTLLDDFNPAIVVCHWGDIVRFDGPALVLRGTYFDPIGSPSPVKRVCDGSFGNLLLTVQYSGKFTAGVAIPLVVEWLNQTTSEKVLDMAKVLRSMTSQWGWDDTIPLLAGHEGRWISPGQAYRDTFMVTPGRRGTLTQVLIQWCLHDGMNRGWGGLPLIIRSE